MFNRDALEDFDVVVFMNTTGDVLNDQQQSAFQSWYQSGVLSWVFMPLRTPSTVGIGLASWWGDFGVILPSSLLV